MVRKLKNQIAEKTKQTHNQVVSLQAVQEQYEGILPHPKIIEGYEKNCPGAADRILKMVESETIHRQKLDEKEQENIHECRKIALSEEIKFNFKGQFYGFLILLVFLLGGFFLVYVGRSIGGYSTIISSVSLALGSILYREKKQKEGKEEN